MGQSLQLNDSSVRLGWVPFNNYSIHSFTHSLIHCFNSTTHWSWWSKKLPFQANYLIKMEWTVTFSNISWFVKKRKRNSKQFFMVSLTCKDHLNIISLIFRDAIVLNQTEIEIKVHLILVKIPCQRPCVKLQLKAIKLNPYQLSPVQTTHFYWIVSRLQKFCLSRILRFFVFSFLKDRKQKQTLYAPTKYVQTVGGRRKSRTKIIFVILKAFALNFCLTHKLLANAG